MEYEAFKVFAKDNKWVELGDLSGDIIAYYLTPAGNIVGTMFEQGRVLFRTSEPSRWYGGHGGVRR